MQWEQYYTEGDDPMLRLLCELYERGSGRLLPVATNEHSSASAHQPQRSHDAAAAVHERERVVGSVHEVEAVRKRCVEGAVIKNLESLHERAARELRRASYAGAGLEGGRPAWLQAVDSDLRVFVEALLLCTQSRKLGKASLLEVRGLSSPASSSVSDSDMHCAVWQLVLHSLLTMQHDCMCRCSVFLEATRVCPITAVVDALIAICAPADLGLCSAANASRINTFVLPSPQQH